MSLHSSSSSSIYKGTLSLGGEPAKKVSSGSVLAVEGRVLDHAEPSSSFMGDTASMAPIGRPPSANTGPRANYHAKKYVALYLSYVYAI